MGAKGGRREGARTAGIRVVAGGIGMLLRRQVTPRWVDDPMRRHFGGGVVRAGGGCPPRKETSKREEREGRVK